MISNNTELKVDFIVNSSIHDKEMLKSTNELIANTKRIDDLMFMAVEIASNFGCSEPNIIFTYDVKLKRNVSIIEPIDDVFAPKIKILDIDDKLSFILSFQRDDDLDSDTLRNIYPEMNNVPFSEDGLIDFYEKMKVRHEEQKKAPI